MNGKTDGLEKDGFYLFWGGECSQWYDSPFTEFGMDFNCAEQFMMAGKAKTFKDEPIYQKIMGSDNPAEQKKLGRQIEDFKIGQWSIVAKDMVALGNYNKFTQNP